jgi:hypothetical protein
MSQTSLSAGRLAAARQSTNPSAITLPRNLSIAAPSAPQLPGFQGDSLHQSRLASLLGPPTSASAMVAGGISRPTGLYDPTEISRLHEQIQRQILAQQFLEARASSTAAAAAAAGQQAAASSLLGGGLSLHSRSLFPPSAHLPTQLIAAASVLQSQQQGLFSGLVYTGHPPALSANNALLTDLDQLAVLLSGASPLPSTDIRQATLRSDANEQKDPDASSSRRSDLIGVPPGPYAVAALTSNAQQAAAAAADESSSSEET